MKRQDFLLGIPCKILHQTRCKAFEQKHNFKTATLKNFIKLSSLDRERKLVGLLQHNLESFSNQIDYVLSLEKNLRMFRVGSDIFPLYTAEQAEPCYRNSSAIKEIFSRFEKLKNKIGESNIRLSMHPGQFTLLVTSSDNVVDNSVKDIEYHNFFFDLIGVSPDDNRCEINIHVGQKRKDYIEVFRKGYEKLSQNARKRLSIENDEFSYSIHEVLDLTEKYEIKACFDLHHHFVMHGEYLDFEKDRNVLNRIKNTWKGAVPELHISQTSENFLGRNNLSKTLMRQHSNYIYCNNFIKYVMNFLEDFDIMVEAKMKNLSSKDLLDKIRSLRNEQCSNL